MRLLLAVIIAAGIIPIVYGQNRNIVYKEVHIIYVQPDGEEYTVAEQTQAYHVVENAITFWQNLSPVTTTLKIVDTQLVTVTNAYSSLEWSLQYFADNPIGETLTIFVIDNSNSQASILGLYAGQAQSYYGVAWIVLNGFPGDDGSATLSHEMGHLLWDLPHQYDSAVDIMGFPFEAYKRGMIGCSSLEVLGGKCYSVYLPNIRSFEKGNEGY